jgi:hypothetical protein
MPPEVDTEQGGAVDIRDDETAEQAAERLALTGAVPKLADSQARKEHFLALLRQLEFQERAGQLIEMAEARRVLFDEFRAVRDAWMNWPARVSALIAADLNVEADKVADVLTGYVHKQLASLAEPSGTLREG